VAAGKITSAQVPATVPGIHGRYLCSRFYLHFPAGIRDPGPVSGSLTSTGLLTNILGSVRLSPYFYRHKTKRYVE
jgi:hypothetical protein